MLNSEVSCREFLTTQDPATIARQIQRDQELCRASKLPSLLALYLPPSNSELADAISLQLYPETSGYYRSIRLTQYSGMVTVIKSYLHQMSPPSKHEKLTAVMEDIQQRRPSREEFETALNVLDFCLKDQDMKRVNLRTTLEEVVAVLQENASPPSAVPNPKHDPVSVKKSIPGPKPKKKCYICQFMILTPHSQYPALCKPCGDYNLASCALSLPKALHLDGKTAVVTGGRLNLGYHTALRLLRCGAKVIVSTRYPRDAEVRYLAEDDSEAWHKRLKIVGADFRAASDVFYLVRVVKECLMEWNENGVAKLDILVNNAAQTLTDPLEKEKKSVKKEDSLRLQRSGSKTHLLLGESGYEARVRGGAQGTRAIGVDSGQKGLFLEDTSEAGNAELDTKTPLSVQETTSKSSWMQSIDQIPYEDVISAHSVNTFVPLILIREFLPLMGVLQSRTQSQSTPLPSAPNEPTQPAAHIINVTSREGVFEFSPTSSSKNGHHVHTNLTKAALNMLTETEAGPAWRSRRVAMNSVDPGYMSAAPEIERMWNHKNEMEGEGKGRWECPIGWEDGAGRVLWPIAVGEMGKGVWGRFLKHFGGVEVDVGIGR